MRWPKRRARRGRCFGRSANDARLGRSLLLLAVAAIRGHAGPLDLADRQEADFARLVVSARIAPASSTIVAALSSVLLMRTQRGGPSCSARSTTDPSRF